MRLRISINAPSPRGTRANEDGSGAVLGTSVMVTVVVKKLDEDVNVPGPVKPGLIPVPKDSVGVIPSKHGPRSIKSANVQAVELPLSVNDVRGPASDEL